MWGGGGDHEIISQNLFPVWKGITCYTQYRKIELAYYPPPPTPPKIKLTCRE